jgi:hypothetical protein
MNLNDLVVKTDVINEVVYDKDYNVAVKLKYLPRAEVQAIMARNMKVVFNKKTHKQDSELDGESLVKELAKIAVKGWKGVTYKYLSTLVVIDTKKIKNLDEEVEFNEDNLMFLVNNSDYFGSWLIDTVRDASNFSEKKEAEVKN